MALIEATDKCKMYLHLSVFERLLNMLKTE